MKWQLLLVILVLVPAVTAQAANITLLTVSELDNGTFIGGTAQLFLEAKPGAGAIFIDSYPLTKLDTQISTRLANQIACDIVEVDCSNYDFFYTINANAPIVGGPSAGGAIALLTAVVLKDLSIDPTTVMTGTINSGGLIGPVAGVQEKVAAAERHGFTRVLIPPWTIRSFSNDTNNVTINASAEVIEVSNLQEALTLITGYTVASEDVELVVPDVYTKTMTGIADQLCGRYAKLPIVKEFSSLTVNLPTLDTLGTSLNGVDDYSEEEELALSAHRYYLQSQHAIEKGSFYTAASFCFGANARAREIMYNRLSEEELLTIKTTLEDDINVFETQFQQKQIRTIEDLETYIIVKERIIGARDLLTSVASAPYRELTLPARVARAEERLFTAKMWSTFFGLGTNNYEMDERHLREACVQKISEAEERFQYATFYFPMLEREADLVAARRFLADGDPAMCIFQASKTKAELELLLTNLFIDMTDSEELLADNLFLANQVIARQQLKGVFPILGYSYYEYAQSLQATDVFSGLLYASYSLELSNLDSYFPKRSSFMPVNERDILLVLEGVIVGILLGFIVILAVRKKL